MGSSADALISGNIDYCSMTDISFLSGMAGWFSSSADLPIAYCILEQAESLIGPASDSLDVHFLYSSKIKIYQYRRAERGTEATYRDACERQIAIGEAAAKAHREEYGGTLPGHPGYDALGVVLERDQRFIETIALCQQAKAQGWCGDWDSRIARCEKKMQRPPRKSVVTASF